MFDFIAKSAPVQMYIKKLCVAVKQIDEKKNNKRTTCPNLGAKARKRAKRAA